MDESLAEILRQLIKLNTRMGKLEARWGIITTAISALGFVGTAVAYLYGTEIGRATVNAGVRAGAAKMGAVLP